MSICPYLVSKQDIVPDLEKIVPPSMAKAIQKEVECTTRLAAAEQKRPYILSCRCEILRCSCPFDTMTSSVESNNESSKFCTSAAAVHYYGI